MSNTTAIIRIESTEQLNLDPSMFGDASAVVIEAQWENGARLIVPACELEFVENALEADDRVTKYVTTHPDISPNAVRVGEGWQS